MIMTLSRLEALIRKILYQMRPPQCKKSYRTVSGPGRRAAAPNQCEMHWSAIQSEATVETSP